LRNKIRLLPDFGIPVLSTESTLSLEKGDYFFWIDQTGPASEISPLSYAALIE